MPARAAASGSSWNGIELDGEPAVVAGLADRRDDLGEVDRPGARNEVMVDPGGRDVLEVVMADVRRQLGDRAGQVLADAVGVADVEVQADRRGVQRARRLRDTGRSSPAGAPARARSRAGRRDRGRARPAA